MDEREAHHSNGDYRSPSKRFHGLHPLKRFKLLQQEEEEEHGRKRDANPSITTTTTFCLPAKKRIWALDRPPQFESPSPSPPKRQRRPSQSPISKNALFQGRSAFDSVPEREVKKEKGVVREDGSADNNEELEEEDDGIVCDVCKSTDGDPSDPIVLCDGCDVMVHASCYGDPLVRAIPEGDWFCAKCQTRNSCSKEPPSCCLCPADHGALKPTTDGRWAHILCALLVPEVFFRDSAGREGIDCSNVPRRRWEGHCYVCETNKGAVIECSEPRCSSAFHASCGLENDLHLEYKEERAGGLIVGFCKLHTHLWKKQQLTGKFKIVPRVQAKAKGMQR
ncbi:NuA3 HAT complex component [Nymphaea thermarum]|nr:NuA3 HAT complex component [Nymphaea thermarum]